MLKNILIVDDDSMATKLNAIVIERSGISKEINTASSGHEAIAFLENCGSKELPEVIFMDINMPEMNGWETIRKITDSPAYSNRPITFVMVSASEAAEEIDNMKNFDGVVDFITKPLSLSKIEFCMQKINAILGQTKNE